MLPTTLPFTYDIATILQVLFYLGLLVFGFYTLILMYHWFVYGADKAVVTFAFIFYMIGGGLLLFIMNSIAFSL